MSAAVEFADVTYSAGGREVLRHLTFTVAPGETIALLGRSGSGKTTALKLVNGLLRPASGDVCVEGRSTSEWDGVTLRRRTGYVMQESGLLPHLTVLQNVEMPARLKGEPPLRAKDLLSRVGLPISEYGGRRPRELSGGQRQRVAVARALASDPVLLLLDEPFGALDPVTRLEMQRLFRALRTELKLTAIFVTHDIREATALGDRIGLLHEGALEYLGPAEGFKNAGTAEARAFLECLEAP